MPASSLIAVLAAALLHASWNLVLKSSSERLVTGAGQLALAGLAFLPVLIWRGFPTEALPYLLVSGVVQVGYVYALATAYDRADLSFVYPIARGSAPVLIALGAFFGLSDPVQGLGLVGPCPDLWWGSDHRSLFSVPPWGGVVIDNRLI